jgi:uncharacterized damage-inducible protein DinB
MPALCRSSASRWAQPYTYTYSHASLAMLNYDHLLEYTDWQRESWQAWFTREGAAALAVPIGPHGDGRMNTVGEIVRHIFSAETRYVERMNDQPLTDTAGLPPADDIDALFAFGRGSREALRSFISTLPADQLDVARDLTIVTLTRRLTPRKILVHVVLHEIRHWAQIATLLRLQGMKVDFHDFLLCPVMSA